MANHHAHIGLTHAQCAKSRMLSHASPMAMLREMVWQSLWFLIQQEAGGFNKHQGLNRVILPFLFSSPTSSFLPCSPSKHSSIWIKLSYQCDTCWTLCCKVGQTLCYKLRTGVSYHFNKSCSTYTGMYTIRDAYWCDPIKLWITWRAAYPIRQWCEKYSQGQAVSHLQDRRS